jgi:hypothetical protein
MSSVTSCVRRGLFICFTCLHVPYSTVIFITAASTLCNAPLMKCSHYSYGIAVQIQDCDAASCGQELMACEK